MILSWQTFIRSLDLATQELQEVLQVHSRKKRQTHDFNGSGFRSMSGYGVVPWHSYTIRTRPEFVWSLLLFVVACDSYQILRNSSSLGNPF